MSDKKISAWQQYKSNLGETRFWDVVNPNAERISEDDSAIRLDICKACPELISLTKQCKKCGCFMSIKATFKASACPIGKW